MNATPACFVPTPELIAAMLVSAVAAYNDSDNINPNPLLAVIESRSPEARVVRVARNAMVEAGLPGYQADVPLAEWQVDLFNAILEKVAGRDSPNRAPMTVDFGPGIRVIVLP